MIELSDKQRGDLIDVIGLLLDGINNNNLAFIDTNKLDSFSLKLVVEHLFDLDMVDHISLDRAIKSPTNFSAYCLRTFSKDLMQCAAQLQTLLDEQSRKLKRQADRDEYVSDQTRVKLVVVKRGKKVFCTVTNSKGTKDFILNKNDRTKLLLKLAQTRGKVSLTDLFMVINTDKNKKSDDEKVHYTINKLRADFGMRSSDADNFILVKDSLCHLDCVVSYSDETHYT